MSDALEDLDAALRRLGDAPVHPGLAGSSAVVFARASARREAGSARRLGPLAAIGAIAMGVAAAAIPSGRLEATPTLELFGPSPPLAPSTLLGEGR